MKRTARRIADLAETLIIGWLVVFAFSVANSPKDKVDRVATIWLYVLAGLATMGFLAILLSLVMPMFGRKGTQGAGEGGG